MDSEDEIPRERRWTDGLSQLAGLGVSLTGRVPRSEFRQTLLTVAASLLEARQGLFVEMNEATFEWTATAALEVAPGDSSSLRVHLGEGPLGRAAQGHSILTLSAALPEMPYLKPPLALVPLSVQQRPLALVMLADPAAGEFPAKTIVRADILRQTAALVLTNHVLFERAQRSRSTLTATLSHALEAKRGAAADVAMREQTAVRELARAMNLPGPLVQQAESGVLLRDLGLLGVSENILNKAGKLSEEEYAAVKAHPEIGHRILRDAPELRAVASIVLTHQEWFNGRGYPAGLIGEEIPLVSRMVAIVAAWGAMTSDRPYRPALAPNAAMAELRRQAGTQFDPRLVDVFLHLVESQSAAVTLS
ncbi:MAG TPA: HD domain-containing phosphohydrolase [Elusimicrobiota bacterium]|nr:HD domain-containing phosphohydrolase [Elusimicrobiota bacterium]